MKFFIFFYFCATSNSGLAQVCHTGGRVFHIYSHFSVKNRGCTALVAAVSLVICRPLLHRAIRGAQGGLPMSVEGATSQLDLPSLTPLSDAGCGRLQLGVPIGLLQQINASCWWLDSPLGGSWPQKIFFNIYICYHIHKIFLAFSYLLVIICSKYFAFQHNLCDVTSLRGTHVCVSMPLTLFPFISTSIKFHVK